MDVETTIQTMTCRKCKRTKGKEGWQPKAWERQDARACRDCISKASKAYWKGRKEREAAAKNVPATLDVSALLSGLPQSPSLQLADKLLDQHFQLTLAVVKEALK